MVRVRQTTSITETFFQSRNLFVFAGWCIFVYNLAPETEENVLWQLFGPFGAVQSVKVVNNFQSFTSHDQTVVEPRQCNCWRHKCPNMVVNISPFRLFAIYRLISAKDLVLLQWRTTTRQWSPSSRSTATRSATGFSKWASRPTRPRLHKSLTKDRGSNPLP